MPDNPQMAAAALEPRCVTPLSAISDRKTFFAPQREDFMPAVKQYSPCPLQITVLGRRWHLVERPSRLHYGRTQRANAGPGLFEQDAVSVSPFLVIETDPCGHVTEATVSPALQARSQFDEPWQLSCFTTCIEAPPLAPCSPFGPASPLSPLSPFGPGKPGGPWSPLMPWGPGGPCSPFAPWGPG